MDQETYDKFLKKAYRGVDVSDLNAIELLKPNKAVGYGTLLRFLETINLINKWQCQRYYKLAIDPRHDNLKYVHLSADILNKFYSDVGNKNGWGLDKDFVAIFPPRIPLCYGKEGEAKRDCTLSALLNLCCNVLKEYADAKTHTRSV